MATGIGRRIVTKTEPVLKNQTVMVRYAQP